MFFDDEEYHNQGAMLYNNPNGYNGYGAYERPPNVPQMTEAERQEASRNSQQAQSERTWMMEAGGAGLIIFFLALNLIVYRNEGDCGHYKTWLLGSMLIYTLDLINNMNQVMQIKKIGRENGWLFLVTLLILVFNTAWYIWGNVIFYRDWEYCQMITKEEPVGISPGLTSALRFMIIIGYITFFKCCCLCTCITIGLPCFCYHYRSAFPPQWEGAAPDLLKRLVRTKFTNDDPESGGVQSTCCVCLSEFEQNEEVV